MTHTTIFYVNSVGIMAQWKGSVIAKDEKSISIRFSKNKAFKYNLKDLGIDFVLVTNTPVKNIGVCITETGSAVSFNDNLKEIVKSKTQNNVQLFWENGKWQA